MAIEDVIAKIKATAEEQKNAIINEAETERQKIIDDFRKKSEEFYALEHKRITTDAENEKRSMVLAKKLELRKDVLSAKQGLIDEAFKIAYEKVVGLQENNYKIILANLIKQNAEEGEEIVVRKADRNLIDEVLKNSGIKLTVSSEDREIKAGFVLKKGKIEKNISFDALFEGKRTDIEMEVGKILNVF